MPSMPHEGPLDLVRQHPEIAVDLVRASAGIALPGALAVSLAPTDMSAVVPVQYLADMVVLVSDAATGEPVLAVIIEPQLRDSETKRYSWPVYVTTARSVAKCPAAVLVVLCPDPAAFAASMGGIDMESEPGARTVLDAMASAEVSETDRLRMTAIILRLASDAARQILEAMMKTTEYEKTFIERIHDQGIAEGEAKGEARGKAEAVLRLINARGLTPSDEQRKQVTSSTDPAQLDRWFDRAITASTAAEVFTD